MSKLHDRNHVASFVSDLNALCEKYQISIDVHTEHFHTGIGEEEHHSIMLYQVVGSDHRHAVRCNLLSSTDFPCEEIGSAEGPMLFV